jgi:hypothetical protein
MLHKFDISELQNDSTILVLGKTRKSWLLRDIMHHKRNTRTLVFSEYKPDAVQDVIQEQQSKKSDRENVTLIMDNVGNFGKEIKDIMLNGRALRVGLILANSSVLDIHPEFRKNFDYVFMFAESSPDYRRKMYNDFGSVVETFNEFCDILDTCTKDYGCLVIKLSETRSDRLIDQLFWYKVV